MSTNTTPVFASKQSQRLLAKAQEILNDAELSCRELTGAESAEVERLLDASEQHKALERKLDELGGGDVRCVS